MKSIGRIAISSVIIYMSMFCQGFAMRSLTVGDFYNIKSAETPKISPDGQWIVYIVARPDSMLNEMIQDLSLASVKSGEMRQLKLGGMKNRQPSWAPDSKTIAYVSDHTGKDQIWSYSLSTGESTQITDLEAGAWSPIWSPDGKRIAFLSETRFEGRHPQGLYDIKVYAHLRYRWWYDDNRYDEGWRSHIFTAAVPENHIVQLTSGDCHDDGIAFSPDGQFIAFVSNRTEDRENNIDTDIWLVPASGGEVQKVFENSGPDDTPAWSPGGRYLAWRSTFRYNYESDEYDILIKELGKNSVENLTQNFNRVVDDLRWHPNEKEILFIAGDHGDFNLYSIAVKNQKVRPIIERNHRIRNWDVSRDGQFVALEVTAPTRPEEIYLASLNDQQMKRISYDNDSLLKEVQLQDAISVTFSGDGGTPVHGWYMTPPEFNPGQKYPLVLHIHGGPQLMYSNEFNFEFQVTAAQGYIQFYTNPRGSSGYGQQFTDEINKDYGGICYRDIMAGIDHMISLGFVDENRLGVTGLSFGGWMTSWIIGQTDRFDAAVPLAPFVNMFSFYGTTDEQFFPEWDFGGKPYTPEVREVYERNSPLNHAMHFRTPTLILHGEADWRCPISEGEQLFTALKKMGVPALLARFPGEEHVFIEPHHIEASLRMKLDWWKNYIK